MFRPTGFHSRAVKPRGFRLSPHRVARMRRHGRGVAGIRHGHRAGGRTRSVIRLVPGRDLQTILADGPPEPARAIRSIDQVAAALNAAHRINPWPSPPSPICSTSASPAPPAKPLRSRRRARHRGWPRIPRSGTRPPRTWPGPRWPPARRSICTPDANSPTPQHRRTARTRPRSLTSALHSPRLHRRTSAPPLPQTTGDPLTAMNGHGHDMVVNKACAGSCDVEMRFERTGDWPTEMRPAQELSSA